MNYDDKSAAHPSLYQRKIIHLDMDAFYASVEMRDNPALRNVPVIIGGSPESRGVVCTANYAARKFGVHSAMACARAYRLCPDAVFLKPQFEKYSHVSQQIRKIFARYTDVIEPLSLDEAYLDVTHSPTELYAVQIARQIRAAITDELGLTASAGVAPNKLIAKIASDYQKPDGITVVLPEQAQAFMAPLPLRKISGIGPATEKRLAKFQLHKCQDVKAWNLKGLETHFGERFAQWIYLRCRGIDERPVQASTKRKSIGKEHTFAQDIKDEKALIDEIGKLTKKVCTALSVKDLTAKNVTLKVRFQDFQTVTRSYTPPERLSDEEHIREVALMLLAKTQAKQRPVRLLGVSVKIN